MGLPGGCRMKLHVGPGLLKRGQDASDKEVKLIFDWTYLSAATCR